MAGSQGTSQKPMLIIDTDAGLDDAQAVIMAIGCPDVHVVAITTVQGNVSAKQVSKNVLRLLRICNRKKVPVYQGCESSILGSHSQATYFHGKDGFGDIPDSAEHESGQIEAEHAVPAIIRLLKEHPARAVAHMSELPRRLLKSIDSGGSRAMFESPGDVIHQLLCGLLAVVINIKLGQISLVCIGPLTNIAVALRLCPDLGSQLKDCFIMGGNYHGIGNTSPSAEFNFFNDPEAAHVVLSELKCACPINMVCWEPCLDYGLSWKQYDEWLPVTGKVSRFLKEAEEVCVAFLKEHDYLYILCDQIAMGAAMDKSVVQEATPAVVSMELTGRKTRGQMVVDWKSKETPNVTLIKRFDFKKLLTMFSSGLREVEKEP